MIYCGGSRIKFPKPLFCFFPRIKIFFIACNRIVKEAVVIIGENFFNEYGVCSIVTFKIKSQSVSLFKLSSKRRCPHNAFVE